MKKKKIKRSIIQNTVFLKTLFNRSRLTELGKVQTQHDGEESLFKEKKNILLAFPILKKANSDF